MFTSQSRIKRVSGHKMTITPIPIPLYTPLQMLIPLSMHIAPDKKCSGFLIHTSGVQNKGVENNSLQNKKHEIRKIWGTGV